MKTNVREMQQKKQNPQKDYQKSFLPTFLTVPSYLKCFVLEVAFSYLCSGLADDQMQSQSLHSH